ncbi:MAG: thiosulfate sulfurtransferase GlpE [Gammaproteobacteria bacterium]
MFTRISLAEAQELLKNTDLYLLDVRDKEAYEARHITSAQHITRDNLALFSATADKNRPVLVYCYHGNSSQNVAHYLANQGFVDVFSLEGGFETWRKLSHEKDTE